ncbi:Uncharacterised protein [Bordetella pertussis]|nr:Uncharacterised protein [Bordetella pertussis]
MRPQQFGQRGAQGVAMRQALGVAGKARVLRQLRGAQRVGQRRELAVVAHRQEDRPGAGGQGFIRRDVRMRVAGARGHPAAVEVVRRVRMQQRQRAVVQRDVQELAQAAALALLQGQQHGDGRVQAGHHVHDRQAHPRGRAVGLAVDAHQPAHGLGAGVVARQAAQRAVGAEAADAAMHQARKGLAQRVVAQPPLLQRAGLEILHQHVGVGQQAAQQLLAGKLRQVQRHATLVAVDADEVGGGLAGERRPPAARLVAAGRFDLQHVGAVVGEDLGAVRAAQHARQVDDAAALQGAGGQCGNSHGGYAFSPGKSARRGSARPTCRLPR